MTQKLKLFLFLCFHIPHLDIHQKKLGFLKFAFDSINRLISRKMSFFLEENRCRKIHKKTYHLRFYIPFLKIWFFRDLIFRFNFSFLFTWNSRLELNCFPRVDINFSLSSSTYFSCNTFLFHHWQILCFLFLLIYFIKLLCSYLMSALINVHLDI